MKKIYEKPVIEIESYTLSASIAGNCRTIVSMGPEAPGMVVCKEFEEGFGGDVDFMTNGVGVMSAGTPFYGTDKSIAGCDCNYSSGGNSYFTS